MEENEKYMLLYDIYGMLLTKKQQQTFKSYYMSDLSLREIAQNESISFQAVRNSLNQSKKQLELFEKTVGMVKLKQDIHHITFEEKLTDGEKIKKIKNKI